MLENFTILISLLAMSLTLWMAFYLFARGYPNPVTLRAALALFTISIFFLLTFNNYFISAPATALWRAILLIFAMTCWYSSIYKITSPAHQTQFRRIEFTIYLLSFVCILALLIFQPEFARLENNEYYVVRLDGSFIYILYGLTDAVLAIGIIFSLWMEKRMRFIPQGKYFILSSSFPVLGVVYGAFALTFADLPMLRLFQDLFVFLGVFLLGISVVLHQNLIERRTILQDFPLAVLAMIVIITCYVALGTFTGWARSDMGWLVFVVIITHSFYDLSREFVERLRIQKDSQFRRRLRVVEGDSANEQKLQVYLQEGLNHLCSILDTSAGLIAVRREGKIVVTVTKNSVEVGSDLSFNLSSAEDVFHPIKVVKNIEWAASAFEGQNQIVVVGVGESNTKLYYSAGDLDLFTEFADHVGTLISIGSLQPQSNKQIKELLENAHTPAIDFAIHGMMETLNFDLDSSFVKMVEDGLRKFTDFTLLGQSTLTHWANIKGETHIERGKQAQKILLKGIEQLRPAELRPPDDPLPRIWYNYVVLHDAYVKGVKNRDLMARLYISEGTFNRVRRTALRGVARWLIEESKTGEI